MNIQQRAIDTCEHVMFSHFMLGGTCMSICPETAYQMLQSQRVYFIVHYDCGNICDVFITHTQCDH